MRLATLAGLYVAVVLSAQIGAQKFIRLPFTHLVAPGGVYAIGVALALVQLAHYSGETRRDGAINAQLLIGLGFLGSAFFAGYIALLVHSHPGVPGQEFDRVVGSTWRIVAASLAAFIVSETVDNLVGAPLRGRVHDGVRVVASAGASAPIDSFVFLVLAFGWSGLHFFDGQLVGKIASSVVIGIPLVLLGRRFLPAKTGGYRPRMSDSLIPSSITGKGSHFPPGGSVLDHAFGASDPYTLGVEEEYMLLDAETFDLVQHIDTVLAAVAGHELEPRINSELMQSVLEVATPVCHTPAGVQQQLLRIRRYVTDVAREKGLRVGSAGTHPFSLFEAQRITAKDRYRALVDQMQYIARRELIFGMHVHVAVDDPEKAIQVVNALIAHLHELVALSASSPFWRGEPTGLRSSRHMVFAAFPRSGPPPRFRDYADYAQVVNQLERTGCIQDYTHIWWDIRLHPRLGTIEIRICDAVTRLEDVIAITAYCQALVKHYAELVDRGEEIPSFHRILTTENKWLAARYGLSAPVMDLHTGRRNRLPVAALVRRTLKTLRPHARDLGSEEELAGIDEILRRGNGADRQLHVFNRSRDIVDVVREIADATEGAPEPEPEAAAAA